MKEYSMEKIENKIRWYSGIEKASIAGIIGGCAIVIASDFVNPKINVPEIVNEHNNTKDLLIELKERRDHLYPPYFTYKVKETDNLVEFYNDGGIDKERYLVEDAIAPLEDNISKMKRDPLFKDYKIKVEDKEESEENRILAGISLVMFGTFSFIYSIFREGTWRGRKTEKLQSKYL